MSTHSDRLVRIAGGDPATVDTLKRGRLMHHLITYSMVITSVLATVSMVFFSHDAMHAPWWLAVPVAVCWGILIFTLERVVTTLGLSAAGGGAFVTTLVRIAMAIVIGAIITAPLLMRIFWPDIQYAMAQDAALHAPTIAAEIASSPEQAQVDKVTADIAHWHDVQQGVLGHQSDSAEVAALKTQLSATQAQLPDLEHAFQQASAWYNCERYGTDRTLLDDPSICAPGPGGLNGNTAAAATARDQAQRQLDAVQTQADQQQHALKEAEKTQRQAANGQVRDLQAQAPARLKALDEELDKANAALQALKDRLIGTNSHNTGFLAQLKGLDTAAAASSTLRFWKWLLIIAFVAIDTLPVISKLSWLFSAEGRRMHEVVAMADESALALRQAQADHERGIEFDRLALERAQADHERDIELDRLTKLRLMREKLNDDIVRDAEVVLRDQLQADLDVWKAQVQSGGSGLTVQP